MLYPILSTSSTPAGSLIDTAPWEEIVRVCRQICVRQAQRDDAAAEALRVGALATAVAAVRAHGREDPAAIDARVNAIFAAEHERVADAVVLADLLVPVLLERLAGAAISPPAVASAPGSASVLPSAAPPRTGDIADFIDEMIAQERAAPAPPFRRAS